MKYSCCNITRAFFVFFIFVFQTLQSQPVLTYASFAPQTGNQYTVGHAGTFCAGSAGANQTWNFSTTPVATTETYSVVTVSSVPCGAQYPSATQSVGLGGSYAMLDVNSSAYLYYGTSITPGMAGFIYSDPEKFFQFPMSYTNSFVDYSAAIDNSGGSSLYRRAVDSVSYEGYGTMITPYGTYTNAICIHRAFSSVDSSASGYNLCDIEYYYWFVAGYRYPVVQSWSTTTCGISQGVLFLQSISAGEDEFTKANPAIEIFPVPFSSVFTLKTPEERQNQVLTICDIAGRKILTRSFSGKQDSVDLSGFEDGIYFVSVDEGRGMRIVKSAL